MEKEKEQEVKQPQREDGYATDLDATVEDEMEAMEEFYGSSYFRRTEAGFKVCFESPDGNVFPLILTLFF